MHNDTSSTSVRKSDYGTLRPCSDVPDLLPVFFYAKKQGGNVSMPQNQFQRMVFAFITVIITVHAFVFYSIHVVNGSLLMSVNGTESVLDAVNKQGGIYMFGSFMPIWLVVIIEFFFAYTLEVTVGSPASFKIAAKHFDPRKTNPLIFETVIIASTVAIMCPAMSFIAAVIYYPFCTGFNIITLLCMWFKLVCVNLPFAFFSQLLFIQPLVRKIFKLIFASDLKKRTAAAQQTVSSVNAAE